MQRRCGKLILGVPKNTANIAINVELGLFSMESRFLTAKLRYIMKGARMAGSEEEKGRLVASMWKEIEGKLWIGPLQQHFEALLSWKAGDFDLAKQIQDWHSLARSDKRAARDMMDQLLTATIKKAVQTAEGQQVRNDWAARSKLDLFPLIYSGDANPIEMSHYFSRNLVSTKRRAERFMFMLRAGNAPIGVELERHAGADRQARSEQTCPLCHKAGAEDQEHFLLHCSEESMAKKRAEIRASIATTLAKLTWNENASDAAIVEMKTTLDAMPTKEQLRLFLADSHARNIDGEEIVESNVRTLNVLIPEVTNAVWDLYQTRCAVLKSRQDRERRERATPVRRQSRITDFAPVAAPSPVAPKQSTMARPAPSAVPKLSQQKLRLTALLPPATPPPHVVARDSLVPVSANAPVRAPGRARLAPSSSSVNSLSVLPSGATCDYDNSRNPSPEGHDDQY